MAHDKLLNPGLSAAIKAYEQKRSESIASGSRTPFGASPAKWMPDVLKAYENEAVRLHEHRDLMLVIADQIKEIEALKAKRK